MKLDAVFSRMRGIAFRGVMLLVASCGSGSGSSHDLIDHVTSALEGDGTASGNTVTAGAIDAGTDAPPLSIPVPAIALSGVVVGRTDGVVASFKGIPYAEPPVGALRWRPPVPHARWATPRDASAFGSPCPQFGGLPVPGSPPPSEDCLTLNVWRPMAGPRSAPVLVFIHGGGFVSDAGSDPLLDGTNLAKRGVVVVTINYRLAQLGFLAHPAFAAEDLVGHSAGNYGFLDQQLALRWVRTNIRGFGGDPDNVTLDGVSSGAISVCGHLVAPSSEGLFRHAIQESGTCSVLTMPLRDQPGSPFASAFSLGRSVASTLGCDTASDVGACLRSKSVSEVLAANPRTLAAVQLTSANYMPNVDGELFPERPWDLIKAGRVNARSWIGGANRDDGLGFAGTRSQVAPLQTEADYEEAIAEAFPGHVADAAALYPISTYGNAFFAYASFVTDTFFVCPARRQAQWLEARHVARPFVYRFSRVNGFAAANGFGAFHGEEVAYVFGNFVPPLTVDATDLSVSQVIMGAWSHFAAFGDPRSVSFPQWTRYATSTDNFLEFADTPSLETGLNAAKCDVISTWLDEL